jgi:hypothetical protein
MIFGMIMIASEPSIKVRKRRVTGVFETQRYCTA